MAPRLSTGTFCWISCRAKAAAGQGAMVTQSMMSSEARTGEAVHVPKYRQQQAGASRQPAGPRWSNLFCIPGTSHSISHDFPVPSTR